MVRVAVPATTANMGPGFDSLGMALDLYSIVEMYEIDNGLIIEVEGYGEDELPLTEKNLVYRTAKRLWDQVNYQPTGVKIKLTNNIPLAGGLGSSAAAIVGALLAANELAGRPLSQSDLLNLATKIEGHPDNVAPALLGGFVVSVREGEEVKYLKIEPPNDLCCIVASPKFHLETEASRSVLPQTVKYEDAVFNIGRVGLMVGALAQGKLDLLASAMQDKLHQPYRCPLIPGMEKVFKQAMEAGAKGVALSGAGPTVIAFVDKNNVFTEQAMQAAFMSEEVEVEIRKLLPAKTGAEIEIIKDLEVGL